MDVYDDDDDEDDNNDHVPASLDIPPFIHNVNSPATGVLSIYKYNTRELDSIVFTIRTQNSHSHSSSLMSPFNVWQILHFYACWVASLQPRWLTKFRAK